MGAVRRSSRWNRRTQDQWRSARRNAPGLCAGLVARQHARRLRVRNRPRRDPLRRAERALPGRGRWLCSSDTTNERRWPGVTTARPGLPTATGSPTRLSERPRQRPCCRQNRRLRPPHIASTARDARSRRGQFRGDDLLSKRLDASRVRPWDRRVEPGRDRLLCLCCYD